jgi:hypothetical protein
VQVLCGSAAVTRDEDLMKPLCASAVRLEVRRPAFFMLIKSSAEGSRQLFRQRQDGNLNVFFAAPVVAPKPSIFPVGLIEGLFVFSRSNEQACRGGHA